MYHNLVEFHAQKTPMTESGLKGMKDKVLTIASLFALSLAGRPISFGHKNGNLRFSFG